MNYYTVGTKSDDLSYYVYADRPAAAVRQVEQLIGPIKQSELRVAQISLQDIPEDDQDSILGNPPILGLEDLK